MVVTRTNADTKALKRDGLTQYLSYSTSESLRFYIKGEKDGD